MNSGALRMAAALAVVLAAALILRLPTFRLPHFLGDEPLFLALAEDLDRSGLRSYSLAHAEARILPLAPERGLALATIERGPEPVGGLIRFYAGGGIGYVGTGTSFRPPLFPLVLAASRRALGPSTFTVGVVDPRGLERAPDARAHRAQVLAAAYAARDPAAARLARLQAYAVLPSLLASLGTVALTFVLAWRVLEGAAAPSLLAALCVATAPIELVAAQRVLPDALATFLAVLGGLLGLLALGREGGRGLALAAAAGLALGLGVLTKPTAGAVALAYAATEAALCARTGQGWRAAAARVAVCAGVAGLLAAPWYLTHGGTAHLQAASGSPEALVGFERFRLERPWSSYALNLWTLAPLLCLGAFALPWQAWRRRAGPAASRAGLLLGLAVGGALLVGSLVVPGKEGRYLLVGYPFLALGTAAAADDLLRRARERLSPWVAYSLLLLPCAALLARSAALGIDGLLTGVMLWGADVASR